MKLNDVLSHNLIFADIVGDPVEEGGHGGEAVREAGLAAGGSEGGDADEFAALVDERAARVTTADTLAVTRVDANLEKGYITSFS